MSKKLQLKKRKIKEEEGVKKHSRSVKQYPIRIYDMVRSLYNIII